MPTARVDAATLAAWEAKGLVPPGTAAPAKAKRRAAPAVATAAKLRWSVTLAVPCRVVSEPNRRDHWTVKRRRAEIQDTAAAKAISESPLAGWIGCRGRLVVTWTRLYAGRAMDDDNLRGAFKGLRDWLANWLGVDDGDPRVEWRYEQRAGTPGVELWIEGGS